MRFVSNDQRRAVFANMFSKRIPSKLEMFTDADWKLKVSAENIPTTSFDLATDIPAYEAKKLIEELDEESLAGIKKVAVVSPKVMAAYGAESGFYSGEEDKVPFGRLDAPKIVVEADLGRGKRGRPSKEGRLGSVASREIARGAFKHMYHDINLPDEGGASITSDLPYDLLEEKYLMQVYDDYIPPKDRFNAMQGVMPDLDDEVWRLRSTWRLSNPDTMEARAWRMGHKPKVGVETFVELPKGTGGRPAGSKNKPKEERPLSEVMDDIVEERSKSAPIEDKKSLHEEDVVNYRTVADFILTPGNLNYIQLMDDSLLDNMVDYATSYWGGKYGLLRDKLLEEKGKRNVGSDFSKKGVSYRIKLDLSNDELQKYWGLRDKAYDRGLDSEVRNAAKKEFQAYAKQFENRDHELIEEER